MGNLMRRRPGGHEQGSETTVGGRGCPYSCSQRRAVGTDDAEGSESSESSDSIVDLETIDDAAVQETVNKALLTDAVPLGDLDPTVQEAFSRATIELDADQLDKAFECWSNTTCEIGDGETTLGIAEAYGENQWRKISKMEVILQALTYPEIGKIIFTDAKGDLAKFQSNVRSLAAQGAKAIVSYNDFGAAALPAFQARSNRARSSRRTSDRCRTRRRSRSRTRCTVTCARWARRWRRCPTRTSA